MSKLLLSLSRIQHRIGVDVGCSFRGSASAGVYAVASRRASSSASKLKLDRNNVVHSPHSPIETPENIYLHELIWEKLDKWPNRIAIECSASGRSYSYSDLRKLSGRLAYALRKSKIKPGDTIAAVLPNVPEFAVIILAASEAGLCLTLVNPAYTANEIKNQLENSEAAAVFTLPSKYENVRASLVGNRNIRLPIILISDNSQRPDGTIRFEDMVSDSVTEFEKLEKTSVGFTDTLYLPYSSGTTGLPKGVELTHRNIASNVVQLSHKDVNPCEETTPDYQDVLPVILPMFHIYGLVCNVLVSLRRGLKTVFVPQFTPHEFVKVLTNYNPTALYLVPPIIQMMMSGNYVKREHVTTVRHIVSGAAPLGEEVVAMFKKNVNSEVAFCQGYGLTETSPTVTMGKNAPLSSSAGYVVPNTELRIVGYQENNDGKTLGINQEGQIYVRGPQVMKGYFKNPEATANTMDGDWFKTGDLGVVDENGLLHIRGRLKELIKVKGFQVAPAELEDVLLSFDKVEDVAVVGVPHEKFGEIPLAYIVPKKGSRVTEDDVKDYIAQRLAKHKHLGHVKFIDKIPKSAAGKILKTQLLR